MATDQSPSAESTRMWLPLGWHRSEGRSEEVLLVARPDLPPPSGVRPLVVLRAEAFTGPAGRFLERSLSRLRGQLVDLDLEDDDEVDLGGREATYRRFGHLGQIGGGERDLITEEWTWLVGEVATILRATMAREDYEMLCDDVESIADSVRPAA